MYSNVSWELNVCGETFPKRVDRNCIAVVGDRKIFIGALGPQTAFFGYARVGDVISDLLRVERPADTAEDKKDYGNSHRRPSQSAHRPAFGGGGGPDSGVVGAGHRDPDVDAARGLEIGGRPEPLYVVAIDAAAAEVRVGPRRLLAVRAATKRFDAVLALDEREDALSDLLMAPSLDEQSVMAQIERIALGEVTRGRQTSTAAEP